MSNLKFNKYNDPYAYVKIYGDTTYGHMSIFINNFIGKDTYIPMPRLIINCQVGSTHENNNQPYTWEYGIENNGLLKLNQLAIALQFMKQLDRRLQVINEELLNPVHYYEYCARILIASEIPVIFYNHRFNTGFTPIEDLPSIDLTNKKLRGVLRDTLKEMERTLINQYSKE